MKELRAIRKATKVFGSATILSQDKAGGVLSNLEADWLGRNQMTCNEHAVTFSLFMKTLERRGLLEFFQPLSPISKHPPFTEDWVKQGHVAAALMSRRTGELFIVDTWYERGGEAAHFIKYDD